MEASFFKYAFLILVGLAMLGLLAMGTTVVVIGVKVGWMWLTNRLKAPRAKHV